MKNYFQKVGVDSKFTMKCSAKESLIRKNAHMIQSYESNKQFREKSYRLYSSKIPLN